MPRKVDELIAALLVHSSVEAAADSIRISRASAYRWMRDPAFRQQYLAARRQHMEGVVVKAQQISLKALESLEKIASSGRSESARVTACRAILELGYRGIENLDLDARLEKLEAQR